SAFLPAHGEDGARGHGTCDGKRPGAGSPEELIDLKVKRLRALYVDLELAFPHSADRQAIDGDAAVSHASARNSLRSRIQRQVPFQKPLGDLFPLRRLVLEAIAREVRGVGPQGRGGQLVNPLIARGDALAGEAGDGA